MLLLSHFSRVRLCATPWTAVHQAPLSMGFYRREYWSGLPFPPPGNLLNPGSRPSLSHLLHRQTGSLPLAPPGYPLKVKSESRSVVSDSLWPHGLYSPWNSPGQNTRVSSLSLLQVIFPTQGLNLGLPHCRRILYQLSHKESPRTLEWVAIPYPGDLPDPWIELGSPALQADSLPVSYQGSP